ncbi:MAG: TIGR01212 family radical SAM protein [Oligoflexia bacterium]|nr:TIGR01212 family radical SAM protein [Oligoflexia bacterium]
MFLESRSPYYSFAQYMRDLVGGDTKVDRVSVDAGFTCPNGHRCFFCDSSGSSARTPKWPTLREQILHNISFKKSRLRLRQREQLKHKFIIHFQSFTNTNATLQELKSIYDQTIGIDDNIIGITISTRSDNLSLEKLQLIDSYRTRFPYVAIELGVQSIHNQSLQFLGRGETHEDFLKVNQLLKQFPHLDVVAHLMLGIWIEDEEKMLATAKSMQHFNVKGVKLHFLSVLKDTELAKMYRMRTRDENSKRYPGLELLSSLQKSVEISASFISALPPQMVLHRVAGHGNLREVIFPKWLPIFAADLPRLIQEHLLHS